MKGREQVKLVKIATDFRAGLLDGKGSASMCFVCCSALEGYLAFLGVQARLTRGIVDIGEDWEAEHFWLTLPDGTILDPTADQFKQPGGQDMPPVFLGVKPAWYTEAKGEVIP